MYPGKKNSARRVYESSDRNGLDSLHNPNNIEIKKYIEKKKQLISNSSRNTSETRTNLPDKQNRPSTLNLFPHIGMVKNTKVFRTSKADDEYAI